jgi:hypothetical protein
LSAQIIINLFIGYQIKSEFHSPKDFCRLSERLNSYLLKQNPSINAKVTFGEFPVGTQLWQGVSKEISKSDLGIFDISENNRNVLIEVGFTLGQGKTVILLKQSATKKKYPLPSDISSYIYLPYEKQEQLSQSKVIAEIGKAVIDFVREKHRSEFYFKSLWGLSPTSKTIIIGPVPQPEALPTSYESYLNIRRFADLDAIFLTMETICRLYPEMEIILSFARTPKELPPDWGSSNLVFVGGPFFNRLLVDKCFRDLLPVEYVWKKDEEGFESWVLISKDTGLEIYPEFLANKKAGKTQDFGLFLKRPLKGRGLNKIIIVNGAGSLATTGAVMLFANPAGILQRNQAYENCRYVINKLGSDPSFIAYFEIKGDLNGIDTPILEIDKLETLF